MDAREAKTLIKYVASIDTNFKRLNELMELYLHVEYTDEQKAQAEAVNDLKVMIQTATNYNGMTLTKTERYQVSELLEDIKRTRTGKTD